MLFGLHAEKITNRCPPASPACHRLLVIARKSHAAMAMAGRPELAMAGRLREPSATSLPGALKEGEYSRTMPTGTIFWLDSEIF